MEIHIFILLTCVGVVSIRGQFLGSEYRPVTVPFHRRRLSSARYEIQPSVSRELELQDTATRSSSPGRRHIENRQRDNIEYEQSNRNVKKFEIQQNTYHNDNKNYETSPTNRGTNNNREPQTNYDNQYSAGTQQQTESNYYMRESNVQHINENSGNQNDRYNGNVNSNAYDSNLKTNAENINFYQNIPTPNQEDSFNQLQTNANARTNDNSSNQRSNTRISETGGQNEPYIRTNANNKNIVTTQYPDSQNIQFYPSNDNVRTNYNPVSRQDDSPYDDSRPSGDRSRATEATRRSIDSYSTSSRQNVASPHDKPSYNGKPNKQNTDFTQRKDNRNYETNRQGESVTVEDGLQIGGTKPTQDNELASRTHQGGGSGTKDEDKWIWSGSEQPTRPATSPLPVVDDRAAFSGGKCPTGQVRFNDMCVYKD